MGTPAGPDMELIRALLKLAAIIAGVLKLLRARRKL
jgi:hypothetical protein